MSSDTNPNPARPREAGPRPTDVPVLSDAEHRQNMKAVKQRLLDRQQEKPQRFSKIKGLIPSRKVKTGRDKAASGSRQAPKRPNAVVRGYLTTARFDRYVFQNVYALLLGSPPERVMSGKPSFSLLSIHRWIYFWFYVTPRVYKAKLLYWIPIPREAVRCRTNDSIVRIDDTQIHETKVFAVFSLKGGVGKTSNSKLMVGLIKRTRKAFNVLIQDNNPDRGTLADRGTRTVKHAMQDLVENIDDIKTSIDFTRYSNELEEGAWMLASTRPGDFSTELSITADEFDKISKLEDKFFDVVILDCGTDRQRDTNLRALERADVIHLITTPAKDSIYQAVASYVWMCKHPQLRNKHIVLVINRKKWWHNLDKIQEFFITTVRNEFAKDKHRRAIWSPVSFQTFGVGWDPRLALGRNFTSFNIRRSVQADEFEVLARSFELIADGFVSHPDSQLTHKEVTQRDFPRKLEDISHDEVVRAIRQSTAPAVTSQNA